MQGIHYCIFCKAFPRCCVLGYKDCYPVYQEWPNFLLELNDSKNDFFSFVLFLFSPMSYWYVLMLWALNYILWPSLFVFLLLGLWESDNSCKKKPCIILVYQTISSLFTILFYFCFNLFVKCFLYDCIYFVKYHKIFFSNEMIIQISVLGFFFPS